MNKTCIRYERLRVRVFGKIIARGEAGFTMVEVLVSLAILAITVTPMMGLFTMAPMLHAYREQQLRSAFLAQLRLEEVKNKATYNFDGDYNKAAGAATDFPTGDGFESSDADYRYTITDNITDTVPDPDAGPGGGVGGGGGAPDIDVMRDITIEVWYDKDGDNVYDTDEQGFDVMTKIARRRI